MRDGGFFNGRAAPDLLAGLDLVALATVADVVPLVGLNRAFVARGLAAMRQRQRAGLAALFDAAGADGPPRAYHLGFLIGPRINAGGRIGDAALGVKLLTTRDEDEARAIAAELDRLNRARQQIEIATLAEAEAEALLALGLEERGAAVVVAGEGWPSGIVGLVAARLKERFERPAFALALNGAEATGSGRSIAGVDLGRVVRAAVESGLAIKGGGHAMAAGVTLAKSAHRRVPRFSRREARRAGGGGARALGPVDRRGADRGRRDRRARPDRSKRRGRSAPAIPSRCSRCRATAWPSVFAAGADHLRLRAVAADGAAIEAIAFRVVGKPLGEALLQRARRQRPSRRRADDQPLRRPREAAVEIDRRGGSRGLRRARFLRLVMAWLDPAI